MWILYEILVIIYVIASIISSAIIFYQIRTIEAGKSIFYLIGTGSFVILWGISRIFYFYYDFIYVGDLFFWKIAAVIGLVSITWLFFAIEKTVVPKTKFAFTIISIIITFLLLIPFQQTISNIIQAMMIPLVGPIFPILFLYIAYKGEGYARKMAIIFFIGTLFFIFANLFHLQSFNGIDLLYFILSPILFTSSLIIFVYVITDKEEEQKNI